MSLAITGAIRGTSQEKLYQELCLESLRSRRWLRCMCYFCKLIKTQKPLYLFNLIPPKFNSLRHPNTYSVMRCRNDYFKNSLTPYVVREWNRLSTEICNSTSCQEFRKSLLSFIKRTCSSLFSIHHPVGVKLFVRLRLAKNICMNINSGTIFMILWILYVLVALSLKQLRTTFCAATTSLLFIWLLWMI